MFTIHRNLLITFGLLYVCTYVFYLTTGSFHLQSLPVHLIIIFLVILISSVMKKISNSKRDSLFINHRVKKVKSHPSYGSFIDADSYHALLPDHKLVDEFYKWLHLKEDLADLSSK